jgi:hypothetical protein
MALLPWNSPPCLDRREELTEKSQPGGPEDPQNPEPPIVRQTWRRMKQSVEADPPPVEGRTVATTQKLRHLKGSRLTSGKRSCVEKGSDSLPGPQPKGKVERKLQEKQRLTEQTFQLDPGPTQKSPIGLQSIPIKEKLIRIDNWTLPCLRPGQIALAKKRIPRSGEN